MYTPRIISLPFVFYTFAVPLQMMAHLKTEGLTLAAAIQERTEMADGVEMLCFPIRLL